MGLMHLAAESHVDRSIVSADDFVMTNVVGTYTMLDAARLYWKDLPEGEKKAFRFLHVSTDEVFGSLGPDGYFTEETPYAPNIALFCVEGVQRSLLCGRTITHYGLPTVITNCSNNYGPLSIP